MRKFKQGKILIVSLICLMCTALAIFPACLWAYTKREKEVIPNAVSPITKISKYDHLIQFADDVCQGNYYTGVTVRLETDITIEDDYFAPVGSFTRWGSPGNLILNDAMFNGIFDGNGHCINGINQKVVGGYDNGYGLFALLGPKAVVKKLRIQNTTIEMKNVTDALQSSGCAGGIAGKAMPGATIEQCLVDGLTIQLKSNVSYESHVAGIVGCMGIYNSYDYSYGNTTGWPTNVDGLKLKIKDCEIRNFNISGSNTKPKAIVIAGAITNYYNCGVDVENILARSVSSILTDFAIQQANVYTSGCYKTTGQCATFDYNSVWDYLPNKNDGYSALKLFTKLGEELRFSAGGGGTVNGAKQVVIYGSREDFLNIDTTKRTIIISGQVVEAIPNAGYRFVKWNYSGMQYDGFLDYYWATFEKYSLEITFLNITVETQTGTVDIAPSVYVTTVDPGVSIEITYQCDSAENYNHIFIRTGKTLLAVYNLSEYPEYCLDLNYETSFEINEAVEIQPEVVLKDYGLGVA